MNGRNRAVSRLLLGASRGVLVLLLLLFGALKWGEAEARAIQPWVSYSPVLSWLYPAFGLRGAARLIGSAEIALALLIALRRWSPLACLIGSVGAVLTFLTTLSFLVTTPGIAPPESTFLLKDALLLAVAVASAREAARSRPRPQNA